MKINILIMKKIFILFLCLISVMAFSQKVVLLRPAVGASKVMLFKPTGGAKKIMMFEGVTPSAGYVRPADWLTMPILTQGSEQWSGLHPIYDSPDGHTFVAISATGDYTVDWGDGSAPEDFLSGVKAEHTFDYADFSAQTPCTRGYKQTIVTVTPQVAGALETINCVEINSNFSSTSDGETQWLDITVAGSNITYCKASDGGDEYIWLGKLEKWTFTGTNLIADYYSMFDYCSALQSVTLGDMSAGTSFSRMFNSCSALQSVTLGDMSAGTDFSRMFYYCYALQSVTLGDMSAGTSFISMF